MELKSTTKMLKLLKCHLYCDGNCEKKIKFRLDQTFMLVASDCERRWFCG